MVSAFLYKNCLIKNLLKAKSTGANKFLATLMSIKVLRITAIH
jgi:hypothetical protein